jgi:hypothetical protein
MLCAHGVVSEMTIRVVPERKKARPSQLHPASQRALSTRWRWPRSDGLDDVGDSYHGRQMGTWSELGRKERVYVGRQVHFEEQETPGWIQSSCSCPNFCRGKRQAMHLGAHVHGRLVTCLSRPVWHQEQGGCLRYP